MSSAAILAELRSTISRLEGKPARALVRPVLPTGLLELDRSIRGWPQAGVSEVVGRTGSGRLSLLLPLMQELTSQGRRVAVVDPFGVAYPRGWRGVVLQHTLLIQPGPERASWACEQLASSGALPLVVLLAGPRLGRGGPRLQRAAERGGTAVAIVSERSERALPASLRLQVLGRRAGRVRVRVERLRGGPAGAVVEVTLG